MPHSNTSDGETRNELFALFEASARVLAKSADPAAFLDWIAQHGPSLAPGFARAIDPRSGPPGLAFRAMGVSIYATMPLPQTRFESRRIPEPGRNEPCLCGSGRKYKHCCLPLRGFLDLSGYNALRHVLDALPRTRFAELPASRVDPLAVADAARQWHEEGAQARAVALLEPWFAGDAPLAAKLEPLFDQLMDCYFALGQERKRSRLLAAVLARGERELRAAALQRRSTILADHGDYAGAWESFRDAQREDPENPGHAALELTLLVARGEIEKARERAQFWIANLVRRRDPALADMIGFLRRVRSDPYVAMGEADRKQFPALDRLATLFAGAPAPQPRHALIDRGEAGGVLQPDEALGDVESRWRRLFPQVKPDLTATQHGVAGMWSNPDAWLEFLARNPLAWQSFDVLDDLTMAIEALPTMGAGATLLEPLLERGVALLEANLARGASPTVQWGWPQNRPALRMLAHLAYRAVAAMDRGASSERFVALGERLIALNPNDNHFMREPLMRAYIAGGRPEKALALAERYPNDFCGPALNRILALANLGQRGDALGALSDAARPHRVAIEMLLADAPKEPKPDGRWGVTVGGKEEAWEYREAHRELWQTSGALDWLRAAWAEVKRRD